MSGRELSLLGGSVTADTGRARVSRRQAASPVDPSQALKDPSSEEYRALQALKKRDREVRQHEQAHLAAAGGYASGGASFSYERGPDGRQYAVGGEVQIDTAPVPGDPAATIRKMQIVQRAATSPSEPSAQDRAVAAAAARAEAEARVELREQQGETGEGGEPPGETRDTAPEPVSVDRARRAYGAADAAAAESVTTGLLDLVV